jgi:hypothetical protein
MQGCRVIRGVLKNLAIEVGRSVEMTLLVQADAFSQDCLQISNRVSMGLPQIRACSNGGHVCDGVVSLDEGAARPVDFVV